MRDWNKYFVKEENDADRLEKDVLPNDHRETMGYAVTKGYDSKEKFFGEYYFNGHPRYRIYADYIAKQIVPARRGLSVACGRCAFELYLIERGFDITCSDLEFYCESQTKKLFPAIKFVKHDIVEDVFQEQFDYILCLNVLYLFNEEQLEQAFCNISKSLKPNGILILDGSAAEDNALIYFMDKILCPLEAFGKYLFQKIVRRQNVFLIKKHHGFRNKNEEIILAAQKAGFALQDIHADDYMSELKGRSKFFRWLPEGVTKFIGRKVPYVRLFKFEKISHGANLSVNHSFVEEGIGVLK